MTMCFSEYINTMKHITRVSAYFADFSQNCKIDHKFLSLLPLIVWMHRCLRRWTRPRPESCISCSLIVIRFKLHHPACVHPRFWIVDSHHMFVRLLVTLHSSLFKPYTWPYAIINLFCFHSLYIFIPTHSDKQHTIHSNTKHPRSRCQKTI